MTLEPSATEIWTDPWGKRGRETGESAVSKMIPVFHFIGGGALSSSYGSYWIDAGNDGGWTLWQSLPGGGETDFCDEDSDEDAEDLERPHAFACAGCRGSNLDARAASSMLLRELWAEHRKTGYDHPNGIDAVESGGVLSIEEVQSIIKEVFA